jgi:biopolymer transport protein ExbB
LVTTLAGLLVAIPAAVASHYFEGRVTRVFGTIDESLAELLPRFEHFEGRNRFEVIGRELAPRELAAGKASNVLAPPVNR